jgi:hypothetical protein
VGWGDRGRKREGATNRTESYTTLKEAEDEDKIK